MSEPYIHVLQKDEKLILQPTVALTKEEIANITSELRTPSANIFILSREFKIYIAPAESKIELHAD